MCLEKVPGTSRTVGQAQAGLDMQERHVDASEVILLAVEGARTASLTAPMALKSPSPSR